MTTKQKAYKKKLLQLVHISEMYKNIYANDKELWKEFLQNHYGVSSSKFLSIDELDNLVKFLNYQTKVLKKDMATNNQIKYMMFLWNQKGRVKGVFGLLLFIKERMGIQVLKLKDLTKDEATKIIIGLEKLPKLHS